MSSLKFNDIFFSEVGEKVLCFLCDSELTYLFNAKRHFDKFNAESIGNLNEEEKIETFVKLKIQHIFCYL